ncbi:hypothetical protein, partial [Roseisolibacter sp. H3M3-2]|uniref:hypothetical protein n=1 Tax=Roseisolibacter sp. H3M3-2 TaxID=3031323 RepID=UPI0023DAD226
MPRALLRLAVLLCLAAAAPALASLAGEYPGFARAGARVALAGPLPLALLAWLHLALLDRATRPSV